ncbi:MAG: Ig-like domain-containing protein [Myxococcota bacterium]
MLARTHLPWAALLAACAVESESSEPRRPDFAGDLVATPTSARRFEHHGASEHVVYLNLGGAELECGSDDDAETDRSTIACYGGGLERIPPFAPAGYPCDDLDACKAVVAEALTTLWSYDWNITFVTERPESGDYEMVMVGGGGFGPLGIAPLDCGDANPRSVSFAFSEDAAFGCALETVATTISQELAHALGLCHNDVPNSIMYPSVTGCEPDWTCGEQVDSCYCTELGYDPFCPRDYLDQLLGPATPDVEAPRVAIVSPPAAQSIPRDFVLLVSASDDRGVTEVELLADGEPVGSRGSPGPSGAYEFQARNYAGGEHRFCAVARDVAGNEGGDCVDATVSGEVDCIPGNCCCGPTCCHESCNLGDVRDIGDACAESDDCCSDVCLVPWTGDNEAYCTQPCTPPAECGDTVDCPSGFACEEAGEEHVCVRFASRGELGWPCASGEDCASGLCVEPRMGEPACSVECDRDDDASCPGRFRCGDADRDVCVYDCGGASGSIRGGCAVAPGAHAAAPWLQAFLAAFVAWAGRRFLRQRRRAFLSHPTRRIA